MLREDVDGWYPYIRTPAVLFVTMAILQVVAAVIAAVTDSGCSGGDVGVFLVIVAVWFGVGCGLLACICCLFIMVVYRDDLVEDVLYVAVAVAAMVVVVTTTVTATATMTVVYWCGVCEYECVCYLHTRLAYLGTNSASVGDRFPPPNPLSAVLARIRPRSSGPACGSKARLWPQLPYPKGPCLVRHSRQPRLVREHRCKLTHALFGRAVC